MLTKKDKEEITSIVQQEVKQIVQQELKTCFSRTITMQKGPRKQGDPEATVEQRDMDIVTALMIYLPHIEGSLLGVQADIDKTKNMIGNYEEKLNAIGGALISMTDNARTLAIAAKNVSQINNTNLQISNGDKDESNFK